MKRYTPFGAVACASGALLALAPTSAVANLAPVGNDIGTIIVHAVRKNGSDARYANVQIWIDGAQRPGIVLDKHGQGRFEHVPTNKKIQLLAQDPEVHQYGTYPLFHLTNVSPVKTVTVHEHY